MHYNEYVKVFTLCSGGIRMEFLTELSWKMYPSFFMMAIGLAVLLMGAAMKGSSRPLQSDV